VWEDSRVPIDYQKSLYEVFVDVIHKVVFDDYYLDVSSQIEFSEMLAKSLNRTSNDQQLAELDVKEFVRLAHKRTAYVREKRLAEYDQSGSPIYSINTKVEREGYIEEAETYS
jgi:ethanolamine utilization cobalamin adenosyltransferase